MSWLPHSVTCVILHRMDGLGQRIRFLRQQAGLSQESLAIKAHLSLRTIARLESGDLRQPHRSTIALLAQAFGLTPDEFADGEAA